MSTERRELDYESLHDFLQEAEQLAASGKYHTVGNWSLAQILWHLSQSTNASFDGFPFAAPWFMRVVGRLMKKSFMKKPIPAGFKLPANAAALIPSASVTLDEALTEIRVAVARFENETPTADHPFLCQLTPTQWNTLHIGHAAMHMSFVIPE